MRPLASALVLLSATASTSVAQSAPRALTLVPETRYDIGRLMQARDALVSVAADGRVLVATRYGGELQAYDSAGKSLGWKLTTGRHDDAEIVYPSRMGWLGASNTVWVADVGSPQVALVNAAGKVIKSVENPSWIHPTWAERRKYPVFASMEAVAMYPDQSMLILPGRERSLIDTPGYDRSVRHFLRISSTGSIARPVATLPLDDLPIRLPGCGRGLVTPLARRTEWAVTPDGAHIVIVPPPSTDADSGMLRVVSLNERGDTLFARRFPQPAQRIPQSTIDSYLASLGNCGGTSAEKARELVAKQIPTFRSPVTGVVAGLDGSVAVSIRALADTAHERTVLVLDSHGDVVGTVQVPTSHAVAAVARDRLWIIDAGSTRNSLATLTRYRLSTSGAAGAPLARGAMEATAALPARSAPASASSRPSHPPE